jgi:hypothetical protein
MASRKSDGGVGATALPISAWRDAVPRVRNQQQTTRNEELGPKRPFGFSVCFCKTPIA